MESSADQKHEMHVIKIFNKKVKCSCGYEQECMLAAQAKHLGYMHANMNLYSRVEDNQDEYPDGYPED